jgi:hypothetical protein
MALRSRRSSEEIGDRMTAAKANPTQASKPRK